MELVGLAGCDGGLGKVHGVLEHEGWGIGNGDAMGSMVVGVDGGAHGEEGDVGAMGAGVFQDLVG